NLPREERYKVENMVLVGLIPGPKEASTNEMNYYLRPLVDELMDLYKGISIDIHSCPGVLVCAALLIVTYNILAARKTCGFTFHNSTNVCHRCNRHFYRFKGTTIVDYSRFKFSEWVGQTKAENLEHATIWKNTKSAAAQKTLELANGVCWSELHRLFYFELVQSTIIVSMHNLFLGTAK
ncbi:hypothetical protein PHYBLDRAFT_102019, partial [Phycomyces blakesleeanus NRRL 1555(-)]